MVIKQRKCSGIKKRDNSRDKTKEHKHMNRKFYFKNILWGMCPIIISILHLIYDTPTEASIKVDLFLILSGLALPCSIYLTKIHIHIILEKTSFLVLWYISFSSCLYNDMYSFSNTFCNYRFILSLLSKHHQKLEVTTAIMNIKRQIRMAVNQ